MIKVDNETNVLVKFAILVTGTYKRKKTAAWLCSKSHPYFGICACLLNQLLTAITFTNVVFPEYCRPTKVSSISSFQNRLLNQSKIRWKNANIFNFDELFTSQNDQIKRTPLYRKNNEITWQMCHWGQGGNNLSHVTHKITWRTDGGDREYNDAAARDFCLCFGFGLWRYSGKLHFRRNSRKMGIFCWNGRQRSFWKLQQLHRFVPSTSLFFLIFFKFFFCNLKLSPFT